MDRQRDLFLNLMIYTILHGWNSESSRAGGFAGETYCSAFILPRCSSRDVLFIFLSESRGLHIKRRLCSNDGLFSFHFQLTKSWSTAWQDNHLERDCQTLRMQNRILNMAYWHCALSQQPDHITSVPVPTSSLSLPRLGSAGKTVTKKLLDFS